MLYALWCLQDLERVDAIQQRADRVADMTMMPFSDSGARNLNNERQALLRDMRHSHQVRPGMPLDELATFPGMPGYNKGPVS